MLHRCHQSEIIKMLKAEADDAKTEPKRIESPPTARTRINEVERGKPQRGRPKESAMNADRWMS